MPVVTLTSCGLNAVTLQWSASLSDGGSNLTNYTLTSSPPTPNCNGSCAVGPTSRQYTFSGLQPGVPYTLGVSGTNCGGTQQGAQNNISVTIPSGWTPFIYNNLSTVFCLLDPRLSTPVRMSCIRCCHLKANTALKYLVPSGMLCVLP